MSTELAKKPGSVMRSATREVRDHAAAMARITEQYFDKLERAKVDYFEAVKRITDEVTKATEPNAGRPTEEAPVIQ